MSSPSPNWANSPPSDEEPYATISSAPPKRPAGRTKFRETRHPIFKGVRRRNADRWVCEVREPNKKSRIWLGTFPTAEMAARAHDVAAMALRGRSACLNFADSAWLLPVPESSSREDIRKAAVRAAESFRPAEHGGCVQSESPIAAASEAAGGFDFGFDGCFADPGESGWLSQLSCGDYGEVGDEAEGVEVSLWSYSF